MVHTDLRVGDAPIDTTSKPKTSLLTQETKGSSESGPGPGPKKNEATREEGAHSFRVVYVNRLAYTALNLEPPVRYPLGSIIIREKLAKADDAQPQHLVAMIKRARGFNPAANDWEFLVVDGAMTEIQERQKRGSCLNCHASQKERDFVYPTPLN